MQDPVSRPPRRGSIRVPRRVSDEEDGGGSAGVAAGGCRHGDRPAGPGGRGGLASRDRRQRAPGHHLPAPARDLHRELPEEEIDKIAGKNGSHGPDVSREGVQRDLLPIVEGSTVTTKYGPVKTDHILFIGSGAFHMVKPADLIPELQGRFPIRVELDSLGRKEFVRILTEPRNALLLQYIALLRTEGIDVVFEDDAVTEIAKMAEEVNNRTENIGAQTAYAHGAFTGRYTV